MGKKNRRALRRAALIQGVPYCTTLSAARASADAIAALCTKHIGVRALQEGGPPPPAPVAPLVLPDPEPETLAALDVPEPAPLDEIRMLSRALANPPSPAHAHAC